MVCLTADSPAEVRVSTALRELGVGAAGFYQKESAVRSQDTSNELGMIASRPRRVACMGHAEAHAAIWSEDAIVVEVSSE